MHNRIEKALLAIFRGKQGPQGEMGLPGRNGTPGRDGIGVEGPRGAQGPMGPVGSDFLNLLPIHLPINVVVVASEYNASHMVEIQNILQPVRRWWEDEVSIVLRVGVRWDMKAPLFYVLSIDPSSDFMRGHWYEGGGDTPTLHVDMENESLGNGDLGDASPGVYSGVALVAAGDRILAPKIFTHELGHLLGLAHAEGTFMRSGMGRDTDEKLAIGQHENLRKQAHRLGGY